MSPSRLALSSAAIVLSLALVGPAAAADRQVLVTNKTSYTIKSFQASNVGASDWEEDILGENVLEPGQQVNVNIDDGTGACHFDFLATFEDADTAEKRDVDVCQISSFDFTN